MRWLLRRCFLHYPHLSTQQLKQLPTFSILHKCALLRVTGIGGTRHHKRKEIDRQIKTKASRIKAAYFAV